MSRSIDDIALDFDVLSERDFDYNNIDANGWETADRLCQELRAVGDADLGVPILLRTLERLDGVDLGTPGPLVHTLESWRGVYEPHLADSVRRNPTPLTVWMVNRILNSKPSDSFAWIETLRDVAENAAASEEARTVAREFLELHSAR